MAYTLEDEFGDIIGKARRGNGLSVGEVAAQAGLTEAQLSQMEDYTLKPTEDQVSQNRGAPQSQRRTIGGHCDGTLGGPNRSRRDTTMLWRSSRSQRMSVAGPFMRTYWSAKRPTRLLSSTQLHIQTMCCRRWKRPASSQL